MSIEADLVAYYEAEARGGLRVARSDVRHGLRAAFAGLLRREGRSRLLDVGSGPGVDTDAWRRDGLDVVGLDLAHENVRRMRRLGLTGVTGSLYRLPFPGASFDASWTMSTFVHVPDERLGAAFDELTRVVTPGAPLAIGTWGGFDFEGVPEFGELRPYRFFSLRSHDRWRRLLAERGELEVFDTFEPEPSSRWEYQFAVLRVVP